MKFWNRRKRRTTAKRGSTLTKHYQEHKELARSIVHERLEHWNQHYQFEYKRVAVRNQRRCWGSCSELGNLNFNYKIIFLPEALMDYIIVHELCHLAELNHSKTFWAHVERALPDYKEHRRHLRTITSVPMSGFPSSRIKQLKAER